MKKRNILIIIIILIVLSISTYLLLQHKNKLTLKESNFIFEFGEIVPFEVEYYLKDKDKEKISNSKIRFENDNMFDTSNDEIKSIDSRNLNVGKYKMYIEYKDNKYRFEVEVKDTSKPTFNNFIDEIIIEQNAVNVDLLKYYEATDLSSSTIVIESDFEVDKVGEYKAIIKAKDQYDNINEKEAIIKVIEYDKLNEIEVTKCLDGTIFKSEKRIESEKKKIETNQSVTNNNSTPKIEIVNNNDNSNSPPKNKESPVTPDNTQNNDIYRRDVAEQIVNKINEYRKNNNLSILPVTSEAQNEADRRAKEIVSNPTHEGSSYGFGENIGGGGIGTDFFTLWKESFSHNNAMLREQNTAIAVSIYQYNNQWYAVTVFRMNY